MQKVRSRSGLRHGASPACRHTVSGLFTPLSGVLFTFPSRYLSTIGQSGVFRLTRWSSQIQAGFHVSRLTWGTRQPGSPFRLRDSHPVPSAFPCRSATSHQCLPRPRYPAPVSWYGLASSPFARHYSGNHSCFLLLQVLRCFTSLGSLLSAYVFSGGYTGITPCGFPHSDIPGSLPGWRLPETFRSLPRPSSPLTA
jgi:hypothetical protein